MDGLIMDGTATRWPVLLGYAVLAVAHAIGVRQTLRTGAGGRADLLRQAAAVQAGLLAALLAIAGPIAHYAYQYLWVHAMQDLLLAFVAPGLIVLGAPWLPLRETWRLVAGGGRGPAKPPDRREVPRPVPRLLAHPVTVAVAFNLVWLGWHLPGLFDASRSGAAAWAEYLCYLSVGTLFWLQLIGSRPLRPAAPPLRRFAILTGTVLVSTVLGMILVFGSGVDYPAFAGPGQRTVLVLYDQQLAGAVLWMGMLPPVVIAAVAMLLRWFEDEESAELSADLDRLLTQRSTARPAWPGRRRPVH